MRSLAPIHLLTAGTALVLALLAGCSTLPPPAARPAATRSVALRPMADFDAVYIAALAATSGAAQDAARSAGAAAAMARLQARWPALQRGLLQAWGSAVPASWSAAVAAADRQIAAATVASSRREWTAAHEELEAVRFGLMRARTGLGMDYFLDRMTAYHEPMEALALAGSQWRPDQLTPERRAVLEGRYRECRSLWQGIEAFALDTAAHGLSPEQAARLRREMALERSALDALGSALRGGDASRVLEAAAALKPPFARAYTTFAAPL